MWTNTNLFVGNLIENFVNTIKTHISHYIQYTSRIKHTINLIPVSLS